MKIQLISYLSAEYTQIIDLRNRELRFPLGMELTQEDIDAEKDHWHVACFEENQIIGNVTLVPLKNMHIKMRQVCIDRDFQGKGIGTKMLIFCENFAKEKGYENIFCHARATATPFYIKHGYQMIGEPFEEIGILHYYMMKKI